MKKILIFIFFCAFHMGFSSEEEGKLSAYLETLNKEISRLRTSLKEKSSLATEYQTQGLKEADYKSLLGEINDLRSTLKEVESTWRSKSLHEAKSDEEGYGFWDLEETTLTQLVMEYGSSDFLYIVPPEMASLKLSVHSTLPIPRESWSELLEILLAHNGIGVKQINPFARQLFLLKQDLVAVEIIASSLADLEHLANSSRVVYIFTPAPEQLRGVVHFFERFRDPKRTFVYQVGHKIALVTTKEEVKKLLTLYESIWEKTGEKITRVVNVHKVPPNEMERILKAFFGDSGERGRLSITRGGEDLTIMTLPKESAIVLVGMREVVEKAEAVIHETEGQIQDPTEMTIFWYNCRHSDPIDLSEILEKVYNSLINATIEGKDEGKKGAATASAEVNIDGKQVLPPTYGPPLAPPVVHPPPVVAGTVKDQMQKSNAANFIPDPKTGAIMMVIRKDTLDKLKELIRKLDVPKKSVEIEVLLFEKKTNSQNRIGLNMLKLGSAAREVHETGLSFDTSASAPIRGLLDFFISRPKTSIPAFDLAYNFLMTQQDIKIKDSPSITTLNQTPATISIVEEISINNGAAPLETNTGITFEKSFSRAQYGTTIVITPTIHEPLMGVEQEERFVTLETNVTFDTTRSDENDRPNVVRRHIQNNVRVLDGQTVILGGLRRKNAEDNTEKIPFLGEIPGIAKLFSMTKMKDQLTEMFIFITPRLVNNPATDLEKIRDNQVRKRAGDIPEFLDRIEYAKRCGKRKILEQSIQLVFGRSDGC